MVLNLVAAHIWRFVMLKCLLNYAEAACGAGEMGSSC